MGFVELIFRASEGFGSVGAVVGAEGWWWVWLWGADLVGSRIGGPEHVLVVPMRQRVGWLP